MGHSHGLTTTPTQRISKGEARIGAAFVFWKAIVTYYEPGSLRTMLAVTNNLMASCRVLFG